MWGRIVPQAPLAALHHQFLCAQAPSVLHAAPTLPQTDLTPPPTHPPVSPTHPIAPPTHPTAQQPPARTPYPRYYTNHHTNQTGHLVTRPEMTTPVEVLRSSRAET